jgi:hypothetical protein
LPGDSNKALREITSKRDEYLTGWIQQHKNTLAAYREQPRDVLDEMLIAQVCRGLITG